MGAQGFGGAADACGRRVRVGSVGPSISRVADGDYYVIAMIHMPSEYIFTQFAIMEEVSVRNGKSVKLVMRGY